MKPQYISDLVPGEEVRSTFLVHRKEIREKRDGEPYLAFRLGDKTGLVDAVMWEDIGPVKDSVKQDDFVTVSGRASVFNEKIQITLSSVKKCPEEKVDPSDFLPATKRDPQEMLEELKEILGGVNNPFMRKLLDLFLNDSEFLSSFLVAPAAVEVHHAFLGGLVEHTLNVVSGSAKLSSIYSTVDRELLLCGGFLHDIGKVAEYEYKRRIDFSDRGRLIGHLVLGYEMLNSKIGQIEGFPDELRLKLGHMVLSHHGEYEWRSPVLPMFPEACILHFLDNMDAKVRMFHEAVEQKRDQSARWSDFHKHLARYVYMGEREESQEETRESV